MFHHQHHVTPLVKAADSPGTNILPDRLFEEKEKAVNDSGQSLHPNRRWPTLPATRHLEKAGATTRCTAVGGAVLVPQGPNETKRVPWWRSDEQDTDWLSVLVDVPRHSGHSLRLHAELNGTKQ